MWVYHLVLVKNGLAPDLISSIRLESSSKIEIEKISCTGFKFPKIEGVMNIKLVFKFI